MPKNLRWYCYYTDKYKAEAEKCYKSFTTQNIHVNLIHYGSDKDWMLNCLKRSIMLRQQMMFSCCPVVLVDSDLVCQKSPILLEQDFDVACEFRGINFPTIRQYSAGIVSFNNTELGFKTLDAWASICEKDPHPEMGLREQYYLREAIQEIKPRFLNLPNSYNAKPEQVNKDTVIIHNVASRRIPKEKT